MIVNWSGVLYRCDNVALTYRVAKLDTATPGDMRAPGAVTGVFAIETAMDELAYATGLDPIALRLRNYAESDATAEGKPFGSKELKSLLHAGRGTLRLGQAQSRAALHARRAGSWSAGAWPPASGNR